MRITVILAVACLMMTGLSAASETQAAARQLTNIPAQALRPALHLLSKERNFQVVFRTDVVADLRTQGASGELTVEEALKQLLAGTGLTYRYLDDNTITIVPPRPLASGEASEGKWESEEDRVKAQGLHLVQADPSPGDDGSRKENEDARTDRLSDKRTDRQDTELEEIVVTAQKRAERLQDVPVSVTAISGAELKDRGAVDIKDVLGSVPGLAFNGVERGQTTYNIRGITAFGGALPTTGIYLDDVSLTKQGLIGGATDIVLFDIDRVEVLKGPQGTLFGGSAMGGAIRYVSARPDLSSSSSSVGAGVGTIAHGSESYHADGIVNVPIIQDVLAMRAGVYYLHEGGYIDNVAGADIRDLAYSSTPFPVYTPLVRPSLSTVSKEDYNFADTLVGRLSLLWQLDPSLSIKLAAFFQDYKAENPPQFFTNLSGMTTSNRYLQQHTSDETGMYNLEVAKTLGGVEFASQTAYFDREIVTERDYSFLFGTLVPDFYPLGGKTYYPSHNTVFSQELRIASATGSDARWRWVAGLFYSDRAEAIRGSVASLYNAGLPGDVAFGGEGDASTEEYAAFGEVTYRIADRLDFTAGVRYFNVKQHSILTVNGPFSPNNTVELNSKENGVNPKFGLSYKLDEDQLLYTTISKGFRPGAPTYSQFPAGCAGDITRLGFSSPPEQYDADGVWTYDLGSKNRFGGNRVLINGALFYTDWKDIQQTLALPNCGLSITTNAGGATVKGMELETQFNLTSALQVGATATYTDAQITSPGLGSPAKKGDRILYVPQWMLSFQGTYATPVSGSWDLKMRADYQYRSKVRSAFDTFQLVRYPVDGMYPNDGPTSLVPYATSREGYDIVNASLTLDNGTTSGRLYINNVLDARPHLEDVLGGTTQTATLRPRTIGVEVRQKF